MNQELKQSEYAVPLRSRYLEELCEDEDYSDAEEELEANLDTD